MDIFTHLERVTMQWLVQRYQGRALRRAVRHAYAVFARTYPNWVAALFDEHFVSAHLLPLLQGAAERGEKVTPSQVAELWAKQVSMLPTLRHKHMARITPAATHFLCLVADELADEFVNSQVGRSSAALVETAVG